MLQGAGRALLPSLRAGSRWKLYSTAQATHNDTTDVPPPPSGPLVGVKVLDLGQVVAGNFCGALLGYFGADVIKVEPPKGDQIRSLRVMDPNDPSDSLWWRCHGRNKRCVAIDLHQPEGRDLVRRLADQSDVLIENFRPGTMEKWGLGPKDLKPDLIYTRISGYGQTGPKASEPGYASVCEAFGGFRHINGYPDRAPVRPNISLGDTLAGLHAAFGAVMALLHRQRSGAAGGQVVDAAITESVFNMLESCVAEAAMAGHNRPPSGSTISGVVPSGTFRTSDGRYVIIGGNGDSVYTRLMGAIGRADMGADNPKYATNPKRVEAEEEIMGAIAQWAEQHTLEEVVAAMKAARVPAGPMLSTADILEEPQFVARGMVEQAAPPRAAKRAAAAVGAGGGGGGSTTDAARRGGKITMPAILPVLTGTPGRTRWAGAALGHHTDQVLGELGVAAEEVERLRTAGVIA